MLTPVWSRAAKSRYFSASCELAVQKKIVRVSQPHRRMVQDQEIIKNHRRGAGKRDGSSGRVPA
jgi:hypothetical protein